MAGGSAETPTETTSYFSAIIIRAICALLSAVLIILGFRSGASQQTDYITDQDKMFKKKTKKEKHLDDIEESISNDENPDTVLYVSMSTQEEKGATKCNALHYLPNLEKTLAEAMDSIKIADIETAQILTYGIFLELTINNTCETTDEAKSHGSDPLNTVLVVIAGQQTPLIAKKLLWLDYNPSKDISEVRRLWDVEHLQMTTRKIDKNLLLLDSRDKMYQKTKKDEYLADSISNDEKNPDTVPYVTIDKMYEKSKKDEYLADSISSDEKNPDTVPYVTIDKMYEKSKKDEYLADSISSDEKNPDTVPYVTMSTQEEKGATKCTFLLKRLNFKKKLAIAAPSINTAQILTYGVFQEFNNTCETMDETKIHGSDPLNAVLLLISGQQTPLIAEKLLWLDYNPSKDKIHFRRLWDLSHIQMTLKKVQGTDTVISVKTEANMEHLFLAYMQSKPSLNAEFENLLRWTYITQQVNLQKPIDKKLLRLDTREKLTNMRAAIHAANKEKDSKSGTSSKENTWSENEYFWLSLKTFHPAKQEKATQTDKIQGPIQICQITQTDPAPSVRDAGTQVEPKRSLKQFKRFYQEKKKQEHTSADEEEDPYAGLHFLTPDEDINMPKFSKLFKCFHQKKKEKEEDPYAGLHFLTPDEDINMPRCSKLFKWFHQKKKEKEEEEDPYAGLHFLTPDEDVNMPSFSKLFKWFHQGKKKKEANNSSDERQSNIRNTANQ